MPPSTLDKFESATLFIGSDLLLHYNFSRLPKMIFVVVLAVTSSSVTLVTLTSGIRVDLVSSLTI